MTVSTGPGAAIACPSGASGFHGDYVRGVEGALAFVPRRHARDEDWTERVDEVLSRPPAAEVWQRAAEDAARLGADGISVGNASALAEGNVLCVTTGQQPGLFLGPLYTIYKAMTAVALARRLQENSGHRVVPVFWNAADDSDFGEVGNAFLADDDFRLTRLSLPGEDLPAGGMVGNLGVGGTRRALEEASAVLSDRPSGRAIREHLQGAIDRAADHGELTTALLYDLLRGTGVVLVDGRWPELRRTAAPMFAEYARRRGEITSALRETGAALEAAGYVARISEASSDHALFELVDGVRRPFPGDDTELARRAESAPETLSPNVVLRPLLQDTLLPNVATVGGPGEISYHAQLTGVYRLMGQGMPILFPRFEATLVPPGVYELSRRRAGRVEDFVRDFDAAMKDTSDGALPADLREALERLERGLDDAMTRVREEAVRFDDRLAGSVDDSRRRIAEALGKLREKAAKSVRSADVQRDPGIASYREFLRPRGVPQERVLCALALFLESTSHPLECLDDALSEHLQAAHDHRPVHWLLPLHGCREETS